MTMCFVDTMQPASAAQAEGWECFLSLPRDHWREARIMFRRVHQGADPDRMLADFVAAVGFEDEAKRLRLRAALVALSAEVRAAA